MHPAPSAPRCLPCGYQDPLQSDATQNEFKAPQVSQSSVPLSCAQPVIFSGRRFGMQDVTILCTGTLCNQQLVLTLAKSQLV